MIKQSQHQIDTENELNRLLQQATPVLGRFESFTGQFKQFAQEDQQNCEIIPVSQTATQSSNRVLTSPEHQLNVQKSMIQTSTDKEQSRDEESCSSNNGLQKEDKKLSQSSLKKANSNNNSVLAKRNNQQRLAKEVSELSDSSDDETNEAEMVMFEGKRITKKMLYYIQNPITDKNKVYDIRVNKAEYKKARKRIQNRESAVRSRQRKLEVKQNLEEKSNILMQENDSLKQRVEELEKQLKAKEQAAQQALNMTNQVDSQATKSIKQINQQQHAPFQTLDSIGSTNGSQNLGQDSENRCRIESQQSLSNCFGTDSASQHADQSQEIDIDNFFQFPNKRTKPSNMNENSHPFMTDFYDQSFCSDRQLTDDEDSITLRKSHSNSGLGNFLFTFGLICMFNYMGSTIAPSMQDGQGSSVQQTNDLRLAKELMFSDEQQLLGSTLAEQELTFDLEFESINKQSTYSLTNSDSPVTLISLLRSMWDSNPDIIAYILVAVLVLLLIIFLVGPYVRQAIFGSDQKEKRSKKHRKNSKRVTKDVTV